MWGRFGGTCGKGKENGEMEQRLEEYEGTQAEEEGVEWVGL